MREFWLIAALPPTQLQAQASLLGLAQPRWPSMTPKPHIIRILLFIQQYNSNLSPRSLSIPASLSPKGFIGIGNLYIQTEK